MGASVNPYMVIDRDYRFVWANAAYERVTMSSLDDILGRDLFDAFPPPNADTEQRLRASIDRAFESGQTDEIAYIEYPIALPDGTMSKSFWSATHSPFRNEEGEIAFVLQHTVDITELETLRRARDEVGVVQRARAAERRYQTAEAEIAYFRALLEQAPGFVALLKGADHRFVFTNAAYRRLLGGRPLDGQTVAGAVPEVAEQGFVDILDRTFASGEPYIGSREKVVFFDPGANNPRETYLEFIFQPISGPDGESWGILIQGHDVTEEVDAGERQRLLINELNHRVKNTLAVVQGLAQQSFGKDEDGRFQVFTSRLAALSGAHNLLTAGTWESADLRELVYSSLDATAGLQVARCKLEGPPVTLPPALVLSLAMIVHELSTNAIKYGALSNANGSIAVTWTVRNSAEGRMLLIEWQESGGPPVSPPQREGFGTRLIRRGLSGQGEAKIEFRPGGLYCVIEAKL
ncbi:sensor histidine kinase [Qipengyuania sediminis]|uniref:sensor histidine kinase n=1 Tax=Qipengyuania sediminis TaxID=1532023 RepID=UPI00105A59A7|nr:PAS domain-containing protein [Qipengyuania sediminis]